jgi:hypothetical protein
MGWAFLKRHLSLVLIAAVGSLAVLSTFVALSISGKKRAPSSVQSKAEILKAGDLKTAQEYKKGGGYLDVTLTGQRMDLNAGDNAEFILHASVVAQAEAEGLEYAWLLPPGVAIIKGDTEGALGRLRVGEKRDFTISLSNVDARNHHVYLHVYRMLNGEAFGQMAQYNTIDQEQIDRSIAGKLQALRQKNAAAGASLKIVQ